MRKMMIKNPDSFLKTGLLISMLSISLVYGQLDSTLVQYGNALSDVNAKKLYETTVDVMQSYFKYYPDGPQSADVQWDLAQFHMKQKKYDRAYVAFLKTALLYPDSPNKMKTRVAATAPVTKSSNLKPIKEKLLSLFDGTPEDSTISGRYFAFLTRLRSLLYPKLNDALIPEIDLFLQLFPEHPGAPQLSQWMGDMYEETKDYWLALASYLRIIHMYPDSDPVPSSTVKAADLYGGKLKKYKHAIAMYKDVLKSQADSLLRAEAQWNLARITEKKLLNYSSASKEYQNLADHFLFSPNVPEALMRKANLQVTRLKQYEGSITTYRFVAARFSQDRRAPEALSKAGEVYEKKMKDYEKAIQIYIELSDKFTENSVAVEKLFDAAELAEKKLKDKDRAIELYQKVIDTYPKEGEAKRAAKKIESLSK